MLWILDDDSEAKTDQTVLFPPSHESNILHVSARLVSPFFSREVQGDVVTSLMLVPAVLRFSFSFPISFHFLLASLAAPGALPAVLRQPAFSEELQPIMHLCFGRWPGYDWHHSECLVPKSTRIRRRRPSTHGISIFSIPVRPSDADRNSNSLSPRWQRRTTGFRANSLAGTGTDGMTQWVR